MVLARTKTASATANRMPIDILGIVQRKQQVPNGFNGYILTAVHALGTRRRSLIEPCL